MLTGDKLETAENIGFSSKLFSDDMTVFRLNCVDKETTEIRIKSIVDYIEQQQDY
jgi:magnesium-transporting ATPase (P-type)